MKIALIGYGKMGKNIESIALKRSHNISHKIDLTNIETLNNISPIDTDIAIEFSTPKSAFHNIKACLEKKIPVISGTTGEWLKKKSELDKICKKNNTAFLYASNFSIGMNLFFELNKHLTKLMLDQRYNLTIEESHHSEKKDSPSGTAITLKDDISHISKNKNINIISHRIKNEIGTHKIIYDSEIDKIEIKHTAKSRKGFALGAIIAAEWILEKKGVFEMKNIFNF